jgi:hypothetical protein
MALRWAQKRAGAWPHKVAKRDGVDMAGVMTPKYLSNKNAAKGDKGAFK